jgi:hypothetical protein
MRPLTHLIVALGMTTFATASAAASVTWEFEGVVTFVDRGILDESVTVGTPFTGVLTFDPTVPDTFAESYIAGYDQGSLAAEFSVNVGAYSFRSYSTLTSAPLFGFLIVNDRAGSDITTPRPGHDEFSVQSKDNEASGSFCCGLDGSALTTFSWAATSGSDPLLNADLPTAPLALEQWGVNVFRISGDKGVFGPPYFTINGTVTRVVPEAGSGGLFAIGAASTLLLALIARRRVLRTARSRRAADGRGFCLPLSGGAWSGTRPRCEQSVCAQRGRWGHPERDSPGCHGIDGLRCLE